MSIDPGSYTYGDDILEGRIILITGSSDGIGKALALHAAQLGAQVILHGRSVPKLEKIYDAIAAIEVAPRPSIAVMDLESANAESYSTLADSIADEFGRLDGLVHNAGMLGDRFSIEQYDAVTWQKVLHVNVTAAFALTQVFMPLLQRSDGGLPGRRSRCIEAPGGNSDAVYLPAGPRQQGRHGPELRRSVRPAAA
ncbi:MAG: SDR family NAD(P)-dependent oxidoreductase [Woeseiaceae bacterium]